MTDLNAWSEIRSTLAEFPDSQLQGLLDSAEVIFDGHYTLNADFQTYTGLCQFYPFLETVVQDQTGKHLRLSLKESVPMGTDAGGIYLESGVAGVAEAILAPNSIIAIPSYLLRFVPYHGSAAVLIAIALRQAYYRVSRHQGSNQLFPRSGDLVSIQVEALLEVLGKSISRAKFFRIFKDGKMDWFVQRKPSGHRVRDNKVQRLPTTYQYRGLVLTPGDAQDLFTWFCSNHVWRDPIEILNRAISLSRDQLFKFPFRLPAVEDTALFRPAASVAEVLQSALESHGVSLNPTLHGLAENLATHLIRPESFLAVPHYWFRKVLPELGDDLGMLWLMSKNCCYIDWARGHDRDTFWVPGGLSTLQGWIRSESLPKRIPSQDSSKRGRPRKAVIKTQSAYTRSWRDSNRTLASAYLCRVGTRTNPVKLDETDWQLKVHDVQLTARDEVLKQAIYAFLYAPPPGITPDDLTYFYENKLIQDLLTRAARHMPNNICHFETLVEQGICQNETLTSDEICLFDTIANGINCYFVTLVNAGLCQFDTILEILTRINTLSFNKTTVFFNQDNSTTNIPPNDTVVGHFDPNGWEFNSLSSGINPILQKRIRENKAEKRFIAWLIYACLTPKIVNPLSLAVTKTLEGSGDPGGPAVRLAELMPQELISLVLSGIHRINAGYLGGSMLIGKGSEDALAILGPAENNTSLRASLQRLADTFGFTA